VVVLDILDRGTGKLLIEGFPVGDTAAHEPRPGRYGDIGIHGLRQQTPKLRMVPAEVMARAVAVRTDACSEALHLRDQGLAVKACQIPIHNSSSPQLDHMTESSQGGTPGPAPPADPTGAGAAPSRGFTLQLFMAAAYDVTPRVERHDHSPASLPPVDVQDTMPH